MDLIPCTKMFQKVFETPCSADNHLDIVFGGVMGEIFTKTTGRVVVPAERGNVFESECLDGGRCSYLLILCF